MKNFYDRIIKRIIDFVLSLAGIIVLIPVWIILAVAIKIDDPGPVLFKQKRIARDNKDGTVKYFYILKYRSMKTSTPKDMPTHLLKNPEQYITRVGGFLRKTSLDELPQIFNIFLGQMAIIGPRPALYNQTDLYEERAKYGANKVRPGLTGWAQINGRDELLIEDKARLDGEYVSRMSLLMDLKCFFGTFLSVLRQDGIVEGGTGSINNDDANNEQ
ncbi:MAG: sugar transferase [Lachnospiraceae bacterium]|nr:sugar transferase [Lachnospiraceae bacterium]